MRKRKWTVQEQANFLKKTGELLTRGYPLAEAIHSLTYQLKSNRKEEIIQCLDDLKEGNPFYKVLLNLGFNATLVGFVYFAQQHGSLATALQDGSDMMLKRSHDFQRLKKILVYPTFLMGITFLLFLFTEKMLMPKFTSLFQSLNLAPNLFMKLVFFTGDLIPLLLFFISISSLSLISFYFLRFRKLSPILQKKLLSSLPIIGPFYRLVNTHYFTVQLSYLLGGGLSILEALKIFEEHDKDPFDRHIGLEMKDKLTGGKKLEEIVKEYSFFERELSLIVKHGQENGKLDQELFFFSKYCLTKLEDKTERTIKMTQPIIYSAIGIIIVSLYLAILLPMFHMINGL